MRRILLLTALLAFAAATMVNAATITILNADGANEGFNDPTAAAPVGGNPGLTIGQQRLNVFQHAANIWGGLLPSNVTIIVRAQFNPQTCTANSAVLGSAGPAQAFSDFVGAPLANTWYHVSLANKLANLDLSPATHDINATFNSNINGNVACLNGRTWYYGYDGNEGVNIELLPVVLHEMGHGLGFSTLVNGLTGAENSGRPDRYERYIRDNTLGLTWDNMTAPQRVASAVNTGNLVWNGPCVTMHAPDFLGGVPTMYINSGGPLPATMAEGTAGFGAQLYNVTGNMVLVEDGVAPINDGCEAYVNGPSIVGSIALIDRGFCAFTIKAAAAQAAGAIAVVIANNVAGPAPALGGTDPTITIPVVSVSQADGVLLKAALLNGTVNVTLGFDNSVISGTDVAGRVKLYAPNPFESGSSVSHFDVSALPNLLMEPAINTNLSDDVDLTLSHFVDLGWRDDCATVSVAITGFFARLRDGGVEVRAQFASTLGSADFVYVYRADAGTEAFDRLATVTAPSNGDFTYVDETALPGKGYRYKIGVRDGDGEFFSPTSEVRMPNARIELSQNTPNPFNPTTTIRFTLPASERVGLAIYSANGALVRMLVDDVRSRGAHDITWDGRDSGGNPVSSGVYFYRLTAGKFNESRKMLLLK